MQRPKAIFWADVQFLLISVRHLDLTRQKLGRGTARMQRLRRSIPVAAIAGQVGPSH